MKWIVIAIVVALLGFGLYTVFTKGGVMEMQPEHAAETSTSHPSTTVKK